MVSLVVNTSCAEGRKSLIDIADEALENTEYQVIFIGKEFIPGLSPNVRFIDVSSYGIKNFEGLYSFICGLSAVSCGKSFIIIDYFPCGSPDNSGDCEIFIHSLNALSLNTGVKFAVSFEV